MGVDTGTVKPLVLFFTGWGMDERLRPFGMDDGDVRIIHSYHRQTPKRVWDEQISPWLEEGRQDVVVVAWSWGVMMAEKLLGPLDVRVREAIALNGTPTAVDDRYGIPRRVAALTLRSMNGVARETFFKRMCGSDATMAAFEPFRPQRAIDDVVEELQFLIETDAVHPPKLPWSRAVVGRGDLIISPVNQLNYWTDYGRGIVVDEVDLPHCPFFVPDGIGRSAV